MSSDQNIYGLIAMFETPEALVDAARHASSDGYTHMDAYTPFPIESLSDAFRFPKSKVPLFALIGGVLGAGGAYFLLWYSAVIDYPWNIGGRPLHSWPSFIPITFELGVLGAGVLIFGGILTLARLPTLYHPIFNASRFERATIDRFFLCIQADDPRFDAEHTMQFLKSLQAEHVEEVPW